MKQFLFLLLTISILSCSNDMSNKNDKGNIQTQPNNKIPGQTIKQNKSIVTAKLVSKEIIDEENFVLKVKVLEVEDNPNYDGIAIAGEEYELKPGFYFDENKEISDNERNRGLKSLTILNVGDEFKAEISLEQLQGWIIYRVLN